MMEVSVKFYLLAAKKMYVAPLNIIFYHRSFVLDIIAKTCIDR